MRFLEDKHVYLNDKNECYTSVTTLVKQYEPEKDWEEIASKYAKKNKKTLEQVKADWAEEGRKAIVKGTAFHNKMEQLYNDSIEWEVEDEKCVVCPSPIVDGVKHAKNLKLEQGVYPELLIFSHKYKLAGQADLVEVVKGKINIKDYKTSKEIKKESFKHWKDGYEMMNYPLTNFMNCNFSHYCVQLNLYMFMLKSHNPNLKIGKMEIHHIKDDELIIHKVPDLQKDIKRLLEYNLLHS